MFRSRETQSNHYGFPSIKYLTYTEGTAYLERHGHKNAKPARMYPNRILRMIFLGFANKNYVGLMHEGDMPHVYCYGYSFGPLYLG